MAYNDYLRSPHWKNKRQEKLATCAHCQICGTEKNLHIHHKRYVHYVTERVVKIGIKSVGSVLNRETKGDLSVLCSSCHRLFHHYFGKTYLRHKLASKIRRIIKMGVVRSKAFWIAANPELYVSLYNFTGQKYAVR